MLGGLLVELDAEYRLVLGHAAKVRDSCEAAWGLPDGEPSLVPLRELLGVIGAHEWQRRGIEIPGLGRIHPRYGVFAPTRPTYVELVAEAPAPEGKSVLDIGTGTGVLACLMAKRGARQVMAIDSDPRAVQCARENIARLGLDDRVRVKHGDLFAEVSADLYLFNPPWLPGTPRTPIEHGIFDPKSVLLGRYLSGLGKRLTPGAEGWLVLSDLGEQLGLRAPNEVDERAGQQGLRLAWKRSRPATTAPAEADDPISVARSREQVVLRCYVRG